MPEVSGTNRSTCRSRRITSRGSSRPDADPAKFHAVRDFTEGLQAADRGAAERRRGGPPVPRRRVRSDGLAAGRCAGSSTRQTRVSNGRAAGLGTEALGYIRRPGVSRCSSALPTVSRREQVRTTRRVSRSCCRCRCPPDAPGRCRSCSSGAGAGRRAVRRSCPPRGPGGRCGGPGRAEGPADPDDGREGRCWGCLRGRVRARRVAGRGAAGHRGRCWRRSPESARSPAAGEGSFAMC